MAWFVVSGDCFEVVRILVTRFMVPSSEAKIRKDVLVVGVMVGKGWVAKYWRD